MLVRKRLTEPTTRLQRRWLDAAKWAGGGLAGSDRLSFLLRAISLVSGSHHQGFTVLIAVGGVGVVTALMLLRYIMALGLKWRFQFSVRSLFVLVTALTVPFIWLAAEMKEARRQDAAGEAGSHFGEAGSHFNY